LEYFCYFCSQIFKTIILNSKIMGIIGSIIIGCLAGFCAGKLMKGGGFGFIMNLVLGLFGGLVGGWLFDMLDFGLLHSLRSNHPVNNQKSIGQIPVYLAFCYSSVSGHYSQTVRG